jgi:hypothetical protein
MPRSKDNPKASKCACCESLEVYCRNLCTRHYLLLLKMSAAERESILAAKTLPVRRHWVFEGDEPALIAMTRQLVAKRKRK